MPYKDPEKRKEYERLRKRERSLDYRERSNERRRNRRKEDFEYAEKQRAASRKQYQKDAKLYIQNIARQSGIEEEIIRQYFLERGSVLVCDICQEEQFLGKKLSLDHDQETEEIRGLLCGNCNRGLGMFKDSIKFLERAVAYLRKDKP